MVDAAAGAPRPNSNGVYLDPDEVLSLPGSNGLPKAEIELLHVPEHGWIYATSYNLSGFSGGGSPLMLAGAPAVPGRREALECAIAEIGKRIELRTNPDSVPASARRQAAEIKAWMATLLDAPTGPMQLGLFA
ncbi:hypothetical protein [Stenotrophomonas maltophilia]|uniref:hypothetical protein n=1 Tax=Stenotrophomonas maltophilia TaxID=40324 RepID=UPI0013DD85F1|nr:hypothetical protein [Stenotrophomonas maltophilia]